MDNSLIAELILVDLTQNFSKRIEKDERNTFTKKQLLQIFNDSKVEILLKFLKKENLKNV